MIDCIIWHLSTDRDGYGQQVIGGRRYLAHRLAYCQAHQCSYDSIKGQLVRHTCDTPSCINPAHLVLGTHADNMQDRKQRGRTAKGSKHGNARLTPAQVERIRHVYIKGSKTYGCPALALQYNVTFQTIHKIVNNRLWSPSL